MLAIVGNFLFFIAIIAIISELVRPGSQTSGVVNSFTGLVTNSVKAAKS